MGIKRFIDRYNPAQVCAIPCAGHTSLEGEPPKMAVDIVWSHLVQFKLKNPYWKRVNGPEAEDVEWRPHWTTGSQGRGSWPRFIAELRKRRFSGVVCLDAESIDRLDHLTHPATAESLLNTAMRRQPSVWWWKISHSRAPSSNRLP